MVRLMKLYKKFFIFILSILIAVAFVFGQTAYADAGVQGVGAPWVGFGREDNVFCGADTSEKVIALTFDDGPHPRYTDMILDILKEYGIKATFFVVGENVELYGEQLRHIAADGHEIGNHTYTHCNLKKINRAALMAELTETAHKIRSVTGIMPKIFRPPEGCCNKTVVDCANEMGYATVLWTVDPRDWASPAVSEVAENIEKNVKCGSIILCHDYNSNKNCPTPQALRIVIPKLLSDGYSFVTVSELLRL